MRINTANKLYIIILICLIGLNIYRALDYRAWNRYYYFTSICTPASHPAYVRDAYFITANDELSNIRHEESDRSQTNWKEGYFFPESYGKELLPQKLVLKYVSYRDRKFYRDTISLPVDTIKILADNIIRQNKATDIYYRGNNVPGLTFLIGIANDGYVLMWLKGEGVEHLVSHTRLQPVEPTKEDTYYGAPMTPDAYIKDRFMGLDDSLKAKIDAGWRANANYRDSL